MKKALIQLMVIPLITLLGIIVNALFPTHYSASQLPQDKKIVEDSTMSLEDAKAILRAAERNEDIVKGMEAALNVRKGKPKIVYKTKWMPIEVLRVDTVYRIIEKPVVIYLWRNNTGEKSENKYKEYLKEKGVIK